MTAPWLEEWTIEDDGDGVRCLTHPGPDGGRTSYWHAIAGSADPAVDARMVLAKAAPALVRALLLAEYAVTYPGLHCPVCGSHRKLGGHVTCSDGPCDLDEALRSAGLPDQASRDEARRAIAHGSTCSRCDGTGMIGVRFPGGAAESEPCPDCAARST